MGSRTKIVVLHMKEIIYTAIFAALGILLIILLFIMFRPDGQSDRSDTGRRYNPGIYTSTLTLNNTNLEVEVAVDESHINSIRFSNQIYESQSLDDVALSDDTPYTSQIILDAVKEAVEKAAVE